MNKHRPLPLLIKPLPPRQRERGRGGLLIGGGDGVLLIGGEGFIKSVLLTEGEGSIKREKGSLLRGVGGEGLG